MNLNFVFKSYDHLRFENGRHVSGPHGGANRAVKVEPNISDREGYTVTIYNLDGKHPLWRNNVQMAPKQMKIIEESEEKVVLRGYGSDTMGESFADYGLTISLEGGSVEKCTLHMHDRDVSIEYLKDQGPKSPASSEIVSLAKKVNAERRQGNLTSDSRQSMVKIYRSVKSNPGQLNSVNDFASLGRSFLIILDSGLSDDSDTLQSIASIGYLLISKGIKNDLTNLNLYMDRLILLRNGNISLINTVIDALDIRDDFLSDSAETPGVKAINEIYKMEIADLESHPQIYNQVDMFKKRKDELDRMIVGQIFAPQKDRISLITEGIYNHEGMLQYLEERIMNQGDAIF